MSATPPWFKIIQDLVEKYPRETTQSLSTLTSSGSPTTRSVVHRQFHLPRRSAPPSPSLSSSSPPSLPAIPLFVSTTDIRSSKASQIASVSPSVSVSWWFPSENSQIRVEGSARVVSTGDEPHGSDLDLLRKALWKKMSGHLRASFARTRAPGSRMDSYEDGKDWPETLPTLENAKDEVQREQIKFAYQNFALVLIAPHHIDYVELSAIPNRRTSWRLDYQAHEWKEEILVP
ncbi:hypothetical protein BDY24DRAFT_373179 [Mrakia frigida]|uniref:uncharacterized protein n=1 Tax=Mrakia frigida TaxID=29902 RepID=UPI003FCC1BF6